MLEGVGLRAGDHGIALFRQAARIAGPVFAAPREVVEEIREVAAYRQLALGDIQDLEQVAIDHDDLAVAVHDGDALAQVLEAVVQQLAAAAGLAAGQRSEEHTSERQSLMRNSYA